MKRKQGVIFDIDGTIVDSNDAHALAWTEALAKYEYHTPFERIRPLIGMGADKLLPELVGISLSSTEGRQIARMRQEIFLTRYMTWVQPLPRARDLVLKLVSEGRKLAIATSASDPEVEQLLRVAGVDDLIEYCPSSEGRESKPDPDVVLAALVDLDLPPAEVVMIGDTPYDIAAATRVGTDAIAFRSGGWSDDHLHGANEIYDDPADLLAHYDSSILSGGRASQPVTNAS